MIDSLKAQINHFFKDNQGQIVIWQLPNIPLYGWIVFKLLSLLFDTSQIRVGLEDLSSAFLFTWAFLELTQGVNYFRRLLGLIVLVALMAGFFNISFK